MCRNDGDIRRLKGFVPIRYLREVDERRRTSDLLHRFVESAGLSPYLQDANASLRSVAETINPNPKTLRKERHLHHFFSCVPTDRRSARERREKLYTNHASSSGLRRCGRSHASSSSSSISFHFVESSNTKKQKTNNRCGSARAVGCARAADHRTNGGRRADPDSVSLEFGAEDVPQAAPPGVRPGINSNLRRALLRVASYWADPVRGVQGRRLLHGR